ncbi:MAG: hypothetical protein ACRDWT_02540 [Jatrophihabitantaceae bacterium]
MTDNDLLDRYRTPLARVHMDVPVDAIFARGDQRRHRHTVARWVAAGGGVAVAVALVLLLSGGSAPSGERSGTQLTAFTLSDGLHGAATLTLHKNSSTRLDPDQLRRALAHRGITALVKVGSWCDTTVEPAGIHQAVTVVHDSNGDPALSIQPSAIPAGAELSIGYFSSRTVLALIQTSAPQICSADPRQAASAGQGVHAAIVITNG